MNKTLAMPLAGLIVGATLLAGCGSATTGGGAVASPGSGASAGAAASPMPAAGATGGSAPLVLPVASDPIVNTSTTPSMSVTGAMAENNVDPTTGATIGDRLQFTLHNAGTAPLAGLEVYYTMTDVVTKAAEHYYQRLDGLTVPAGASTTVYFDNKTGVGHYPENQFSIYRSSRNQVDFAIEVSAKGARIVHATAVKSKGTAEKVD